MAAASLAGGTPRVFLDGPAYSGADVGGSAQAVGGPPCVAYIGIETSARTRQRGHSDRAKRWSRKWMTRPQRGQFRDFKDTS